MREKLKIPFKLLIDAESQATCDMQGGKNKMNNYDRIWATVDLDAIKHNMAAMKANLREETKIITVVKTDGYGHGAVPIAHEIEDLPYLYGFAVATVERSPDITGQRHAQTGADSGLYLSLLLEKWQEEIRPAVFREGICWRKWESGRFLRSPCENTYQRWIRE